MAAGGHIVLGQDVRSDKPCGFTFSRKRTDPVEVIVLAPSVWIVLHVLPYSVGYLLEFQLDVICVMDGAPGPAVLDPPEILIFRIELLVIELDARGVGLGSRIAEVLVREMVGPVRSLERMVLFGFAELEQYGVAHGERVASLGKVGLVELRRELPSYAELGSGKAEDSVAGAVHEHLALDGVIGVSISVPGLYCCDAVSVHDNAVDRSVEEKGDVLLFHDGSVHHVVPDGVALERIEIEILALDFLKNSRLCVLVSLGATDSHPDFARSVASENRAVLDQDYFTAMSCGRNSCADSGESASCHDNIGLDGFVNDCLFRLFSKHLGGNRLSHTNKSRRHCGRYCKKLVHL